MNPDEPMFAESFEWAVIRIATYLGEGEKKSRLLFATVTLLTKGRPAPNKMSGRGLDINELKSKEGKVFFRRVTLSASEAISWYRSLDEENSKTPLPSLKEHQIIKRDDISFDTPDLVDDPLWPTLGLPLNGEWLSRDIFNPIKTCPFLGTVASRVHRRFGKKTGFEAFLKDPRAVKFIANRLHINLKDYPEYLGSLSLVVPDPVIAKVNNFMIPAQEGKGERIFYHITPKVGQTLLGLKITLFDIQADLLSNFTTLDIPNDGILDIEKTRCTGQYGYAITHPQHGVLYYSAPSGFLREINIQSQVVTGRLDVVVPESDSPNAANTHYNVARRSKMTAQKVGQSVPENVNARVGQAISHRKTVADQERLGQHWFQAGERAEAAELIRNLIGNAQSRVLVADPYFGALQVPQFLYAITMGEVKITVLTSRLAFEKNEETGDDQEAKQPLEKKLMALDHWVNQLKQLGNKSCDVMVMPGKTPKLHDRFLVIDESIWLVGASLNAIGNRSSMMIKLPNPMPVRSSLNEILSDSRPYKEQYQRYYSEGIDSGKR